ncbi:MULTISPECIES: HemK2/MTQ2 family protein methyltransferase [unclassified Streptomyces]|uniref:HemK2/MTQ2 family protein methyltransferase n=1 Tax=unclassified Streptomyces TaxID=2593676 RepID=UPI001E194785|nr:MULTISPECIES: HemK2/MTQ2 family protein methyltransferase [unclassified Streptomyces]MBD0711165.1 methyltransferase [Streptomyces sp. CBMA291]MBD0714196.1 methyltransferase [Streptomyces sp. CBMA370]
MVTVPGVYAPQDDTRLLAAALAREDIRPGAEALDLCTGSGVLAVTAARRGARVTAVDVSRRAVWNARLNALLARRRIRVRRGDLTESLPPEERFDLVVSNPPYVPAPPGVTPVPGPGRAWDAGATGRELLDRICEDVPDLLKPGGLLLLVHSALCGPDETLSRLAGAGLLARVDARARIPFGPVLRSRLDRLRACGLLDPWDESEELVIIRAWCP